MRRSNKQVTARPKPEKKRNSLTGIDGDALATR